jgi:hypothetical protein
MRKISGRGKGFEGVILIIIWRRILGINLRGPGSDDGSRLGLLATVIPCRGTMPILERHCEPWKGPHLTIDTASLSPDDSVLAVERYISA